MKKEEEEGEEEGGEEEDWKAEMSFWTEITEGLFQQRNRYSLFIFKDKNKFKGIELNGELMGWSS